MRRKACVLLFSGGLDSSILLIDLIKSGFTVYPYTVGPEANHKASVTDDALRACIYLRKKLGDPKRLMPLHVDIFVRTDFKKPRRKSFEFVNRNLTYLVSAANYALIEGASSVAFGAYEDKTGYADTTKEFCDSIRETFRISNKLELITMSDRGYGCKASAMERLYTRFDFTKEDLRDLIRNVRFCLNMRDFRLHWRPYGFGCGQCKSCKTMQQEFYTLLSWRGWKEHDFKGKTEGG